MFENPDKRIWSIGIFLFIALIVSATGIVWACGGGMWPAQMLSDRDWTLRSTPYNSLSYELKQLDALEPENLPLRNEVDERLDLTPEQYQQTLRMRRTLDGDKAYALGEGLPEDARLYTAAAVDYHAYIQQGADYSVWKRAYQRFGSVLELPAEQGQFRSAWAAYMLGRMHLRQINMPEALPHNESLEIFQEQQQHMARHYFQLTRELVRSGVNDAQDLGVASLGEEARTYIWYCSWLEISGRSHRSETSFCVNRLSAEDVKHAIHLYAKQVLALDNGTSHENNGYSSLTNVSGFIYKHPQLFASLITDPVARRVLVIDGMRRTNDFGNTGTNSSSALAVLADVMATLPEASLNGDADRLAALAYRTGRYELAAKFAALSDTPLAAWVRAKLALQKGDTDEAMLAYAQALCAFPTLDVHPPSISPGNEGLIYAETGVLALARREYMQAMMFMHMALQRDEHARDAQNWGAYSFSYAGSDKQFNYYRDASYLAERILTTDELKTFIDQNIAATPGAELTNYACSHRPVYYNDCLRWILARKLMRDQRYEEAAAYFPVLYNQNENMKIDLFAQAQAYVHALHESRKFWHTDITKAQYLFEAAMILRFYGKELLGYEGHFQHNPHAGIDERPRSSPLTNGTWQSDDEHIRYAATSSGLKKPWYYREMAIRLVEQAADKVPARSQAFAAMLCQASNWGNMENKKNLYERYLREGAHVPWRFNNRDCPMPDFDKAWRDYWTLNNQAWGRAFDVPVIWGYIAAGTCFILVVILWIRRYYR